MYIIRETFTAKPGQAGKLAKLLKKTMADMRNTRVLTDVVAKYNTVVMEREVESLAEFDKEMEDYRSGKMKAKMKPEDAAEMAKYTELWTHGKREIFRVE